MKNAFGGLLFKNRHYTRTWIHETLVDLLAIQKEIHPGIFAIMDGTTAGNGAGPRMAKPIVKNIILASADIEQDFLYWLLNYRRIANTWRARQPGVAFSKTIRSTDIW